MPSPSSSTSRASAAPTSSAVNGFLIAGVVLFVISLAFMGVDGYMEQMQQFQQQIESNS